MNDRPIGVFDSGVGGLTVVKELSALLPCENIVYFGDTARVPYGNKSMPAIRRFSLEIAQFLESLRVKIIVVACNTASALALDYLRRQITVPVIGVIDPGVRGALKHAPAGKIGVIGTRATIRSGAYQTRIHQLKRDCMVYSKSCPLLVPLVEENLLAAPVTEIALEMYLTELRDADLETLILACTHYPLLKKPISDFLGSSVHLVDSAFETAVEVSQLLNARRMNTDREVNGNCEFYVSDDPEDFVKIGNLFLGNLMDRVTLQKI